MIKLDENDHKIISILKDDSRCPARSISKKISLPVTTVYNRIKRLEKAGIIEKYSIVVDDKKLGKNLTAYVLLHYNIAIWGKSSTRQQLKKQLLALQGVEEIKYLLGQYDILLKIKVKDIDELNHLILDNFRKIAGVGTSETFIVLEDVK